MISFSELKRALVENATAEKLSPNQPLSDSQYNSGFETLINGSEWSSYEGFIIPELSQQLKTLLDTRATLSVLEIGPGSKSVLGYVPLHLRRKIGRYTAFEPNLISATSLEDWISSCPESNSPFPCLDTVPDINGAPFVLEDEENNTIQTDASNDVKAFDLILFCHSMYGMKPKERFIRKALRMLVSSPESGKLVIFHRDHSLELNDLASCYTAIFPTAIFSVEDKDEALDAFFPFVTGFVKQDAEVDMTLRIKWRETCRALAFHDEKLPGYLLFSSPQRMVSMTKDANALPYLVSQVPLAKDRIVKSWEARLHQPTSILRPTTVEHVQQCIQWALKHKLKLTVIGGGHSAYCLWPNVVSLDMEAFNRVHIIRSSDSVSKFNTRLGSASLIVAEAGCKAGDIIRKAMEFGLTVPLGSRPSVGAGLWLQGGVGHLSRLHGLACDNIVGAVIVSVISGQILHIGQVPTQNLPAGAIRPKNEIDLLWAIKGAGTNFGIVISVTFKSFWAPNYSVRKWIFPVSRCTEVRLKLGDVKSIAKDLPRSCSIDAYLYSDNNELHLGVTLFQASRNKNFEVPPLVDNILGPVNDYEEVDSVGLFETEMYMSTMRSGQGKTSSFKRCLFLNNIEDTQIIDILTAAIQNRPTPSCYFHLLHCGGAIRDNTTEASAFGCRDWEFACVITGAWSRDQIGTEPVHTTVQWVYDIVKKLLPFCSGVYSADLGPDPRDKTLVTEAFGVNLPRLAQLKRTMDPYNILAYACPLFEPPVKQKLVILVSGDSAAGKDFCAEIWVNVITACTSRMLTARSVSISDATKREYATETGADINRLLLDRSYKEEHRPALTKFYKKQVVNRPRLPMEHFESAVRDSGNLDVLFITGMRDEAPLTTFSPLVPDSRVLDVRVNASLVVLRARKGDHDEEIKATSIDGPNPSTLNYCPSLIFDNETTGREAAETFAKKYLLPFLNDDFTRLANMVRAVPNHPRQGVIFRHVLDICQQPGGLTLCTDLLQRHFIGEWAKVDTLICCESGGFVFASALGARTGIPVALIRGSGKLPPLTISVEKSPSHISSTESGELQQEMFEMDAGLVSKSNSVVVVDDVLATGRTLCAVLKLLMKAGVRPKDIRVMVVAEFPTHSGRELLRRKAFGDVMIQSLLVFGDEGVNCVEKLRVASNREMRSKFHDHVRTFIVTLLELPTLTALGVTGS
ncbi:hypothetical protein BGAL_0364g00050 [Botrytis galanthina]|uniref:FAD-binding PCMH-type domain-containing protein n=1 Tax=Botrytis galanthina TaxID=278940 RepID=A0A4S8QRA0_9HELO|nr:hypothetical protein BGAL_0364g00050 [Botrytis galanthina]